MEIDPFAPVSELFASHGFTVEWPLATEIIASKREGGRLIFAQVFQHVRQGTFDTVYCVCDDIPGVDLQVRLDNNHTRARFFAEIAPITHRLFFDISHGWDNLYEEVQEALTALQSSVRST